VARDKEKVLVSCLLASPVWLRVCSSYSALRP